MNLRQRLAEVQLALMLLTRLPVGRISGDAPQLSAARWAFPLVGAIVGGATWAVHAGALGLGLPSGIAAGLALTAMVLLTGALHFDGLADYADGIGGGRDKAHALEIMRDSRVGSYGVIALVLVTGLWIASVDAAAPNIADFIWAAMLSRAAMVGVQEILPLARSDGMAQLAAGRSLPARAMVVLLAGLTLLFWPLQLLACIVVASAIGLKARRRLGGQTGDVLGAVQLSSETAIWIALASSA